MDVVALLISDEKVFWMKKVCVFTGAASGINKVYKDAAYQMGQMLAARGLGLVYGGGKLGLMGAVADGMLAANGKVTGIIPKFLDNVEYTFIETHDKINSLKEETKMMKKIIDEYKLNDKIFYNWP